MPFINVYFSRASEDPSPQQQTKEEGQSYLQRQVSTPAEYEHNVIQQIENEYSRFPALKETLGITVSIIYNLILLFSIS